MSTLNLLIFIRISCMLCVLSVWAAPAWALSCKEASTGILHQTIPLQQDILVSSGDSVRGRILWRSENYTVSFRCVDAQSAPQGEEAFFYWDPKHTVSVIHPSIEVGVTINNVDHRIEGGARVLIGQGTAPPATQANCRLYWNNSRAKVCATSMALTVTFSVFIRATGAAFPSNGQIDNNGTHDLFQVDGVAGLNTTPNSNYRAGITGLGRIRFIACNPQIRIAGNAGNNVDFGRISSADVKVGSTAKSVPFSVEVDMTHPTAGNQCDSRMLVATFSTLAPVQDGTTLLPAPNGGYGIVLSQANTPRNPIRMKTVLSLGTINNTLMRYDFLASLVWLKQPVRLGPFSASATVDVTFR